MIDTTPSASSGDARSATGVGERGPAPGGGGRASPRPGCAGATASGSRRPGVVNAIGAENEYANVLSPDRGRYVHVSSILDNPNTDPHTFESSPSVAKEVSAAQLIVQNGVGYDTS